MGYNNPKVSVLVPSLNAEKYISQCIESIINQTLKDIEIICIDAGSTDKTIKILNKYANKDSRIKIVNSSRKSYGYQMNLGLNLANGEYIGIVESDDFIDKEMYEKLYNLTENGSVDVSKGTFYHFYDYNPEGPNLEIDWAKQELKNIKNTFTIKEQERFIDGHPSIWAGIYRRQFLRDNKISFIEEPGGGWVDNGFFFETSCAAEKIIYRPEPYYYYREDNPNSSSNNLIDFTIPIRRMIENLEILNEYNYHQDNVLVMAYLRVFAYLNNIYRRDGYEKHMSELVPYIHEMMLMLDERIVLNYLNRDQQKEYYRYLSVDVYGFNELYDNYLDIKSENSKNYDELMKLREENHNLKLIEERYTNALDELKKLNLEKELLIHSKNQLHQYIFDVENSKAYKLGLFLASPFRKRKSKQYNKNKKLNVLFIPSDNNRTSGAFLSMANLIVNLKNKYDINEYVILPNEGNGEAILLDNGINFKLINSRDWVVPLSQKRDSKFISEVNRKRRINDNAILDIRKVIQEKDIDIVHINTTYSYVGAEAAIGEKIPFVWHLREFLEEDQSNTLWDREQGNQLINRADKIIAISDSIFRKYENIFDKNRLVRIYNGIDANRFYKPEKNIFNDNIIKFIMVGGFEYYKGQIEFAKACVELYSSGFHDFEVCFVGTGRFDVRKQVEEIFSTANMENVSYEGYKENVEDYYEKSDVSFTCAKSEAFGRTTVEAMLSGNIVVGVDSAGTQELINNGKTGILYKQGDSHDLFVKMLDVINNKDNSKKIAAEGRKFMYENMTAEINADNIYSIYNEIISKKHDDF